MKKSNKKRIYQNYFKRPMDFILSLVAIIVLSPILVIIAILVRIKLGSPVMFRQKRPGLDEKIFTIFKFRTMTDEKDENRKLLPDSVRLTKFGRLLRSMSIDELPELFNILKGDMSIVGPRPQLIRDMVFMAPEQRQRYRVLPGLSGWAQIKGRNSITWDRKLELDLEYIRNITFFRDWKIIFITFVKIFKREDTGNEGMDIAEDLCDYLLREKKISKEEYNSIMGKNKNLLVI